MADPKDMQQTQQTQVDRNIIRESISERIERDHQEKLAEAQKTRRQARDERAKARKKAREHRGREASKKRQSALAQSQAKVQSNVTAAAQSLQKAIRAAQESPIHRHSPEGREQLRIVRSLSAALGALRGVGRGTYYKVDTDFANDVEA
jgi:hypothetical protein